MLSALDKKLLRELWQLKGQVIAISLVLAAGIATYVMAAATLESLQSTQAQLYSEFRFPQIFASLKRAPEYVGTRLASVPGIREMETRVVAPATMELEGYDRPINGQIVSLGRHPILNLLYLRSGRMPDPDASNEVLVSDGFAEAHDLSSNPTLLVTINGHQRRMNIVGVASTPEFLYQLAPGSIVPDFANYAILWMDRRPLEAAYNMTGAFNQVAAKLDPGASLQDAIDAWDAILEPYGGLGAYGRKDQISHRYLSEEFRQLEQMATLFPVIFLSVAAFLLNVVLGRLMATQRGQIAILKAFGYTNAAIVIHFLKLAVMIIIIGCTVGILTGGWLGQALAGLYMDVYRFPYLHFHIDPKIVLISVGVSVVAGTVGAVFSVLRAAGESPAVAMLPASPGMYRPSIVERMGLDRFVSQPTRMILRNLERRPLKSALSILGVSMSTAILLIGGFWSDAVDYMVFAQLRRAQLEDIAVTFVGPVSENALYSLESMPEVYYSEPTRAVAARLRFEQRSYRTSLQGMLPDGALRRLLNRKLERIPLLGDGLVMTDYLANYLGAKPGDMITVELLEGSRAVRQLPLMNVASEWVGVNAYMPLESLNEFMHEGNAVTGAFLSIDREEKQQLYADLEKMPAVAGTANRRDTLESFYDTMAEQLLTFAFFNTLLASTIAIGVIYNTARITLSERSRELASLRVLGYTRGEVSYILLGELAVVVFLAIPVGMVIGYGLAGIMAASAQTEIFRVPLVIDPETYAFAGLVVLVATAVSALIVRVKVDHLDLVEVLKARE